MVTAFPSLARNILILTEKTSIVTVPMLTKRSINKKCPDIPRITMSKIINALLIASLILTPMAPAVAEDTSQELSLEQCVSMALKHSYSVKEAEANYEDARMQTYGTYGAGLPLLQANSTFKWYDQSSVSIGSTSSAGAITVPDTIPAQYQSLYQEFAAGIFAGIGQQMGQLFKPVDQRWKFNVTLSATQPLSLLYTVYLASQIADDYASVMQLNIETSKRMVALAAINAFYGVKSAESSVNIALRAEEQLDAHLRDSTNFFDQGLITKGALLRVRMERSKAKQLTLQSRHQLDLLKATMAQLLGQRASDISLADNSGEPMPETPCAQKQCIASGLKKRPELIAARKNTQILRDNATIKYVDLIPQIFATGSYTYLDDGDGKTPAHSYNGGFMLTWNFWDWGQTYFQAKSASAKANAATMQFRKLNEDIALQIDESHRNLDVAREQIDLANVTLEQAEENYRIEKESYNVHQTTATELLDAQTALTQASMGLVMAEYQYRMSFAALLFQIGEFPLRGSLASK